METDNQEDRLSTLKDEELILGSHEDSKEKDDKKQEGVMKGKEGANAKLVRATTVMKELVEIHDFIERVKRGEADVPRFIHTTYSDAIFGFIICLNTIFIGVDVNIKATEGASETFPDWVWCVETFFLAVFCLEISLRIQADGVKKYYKTFWGIFDSAVTGMGVIDTWIITPYYAGQGGGSSALSSLTILRIFRILRLVRVVRLLRVFKELVLLIRTLGEALKAVFWMGLLLMVVIFVGGVFCTVLLSPGVKRPGEIEEEGSNEDRIRQYFGTLTQSLYTHCILLITEGWNEIAEVTIELHGWGWSLYFIVFIMITNFALLNMVVAVITEKILQLDQEDLPFEQLQEELKQFRVCLEGVFSLADVDHSGNLKPEELQKIFEDRQLRRVLEAFEVNCAMPFEYIWPIIDWNNDGEVTFDEFVEACLRLRGSRGKHNFQVLILQSDIQKGLHSLRNQLRDVDDRVKGAEEASEKHWNRVEEMLVRDHQLLLGALEPDQSGEGICQNGQS